MASSARNVKIMVACGSGIATSMHVAVILREKLEEAKLYATIDGCSVNELPYRSGGYDIIVSTAQVPFEMKQAVFNAVPILTGIGEEKVIADILAKVREIGASVD